MTSLNASHLSQTRCLGRSRQSNTLTKRNHFLWRVRGGPDTFCLPVCFPALLVYASFFLFLCYSNHSLTPELMPPCNIMHTHTQVRQQTTKPTPHQWRTRLYWTVWPTELCGGRIKEQLLCHRSSQLSGVCMCVWRPQRAKSLRLNLSFLRQQEVGYGSVCVCVSGKGVSALQPQGLFWAYIITSQRIVVVSSSWRSAGVSPVASSGCSGHCGKKKVKCRGLPNGEIWSRSYMFSWECVTV